MQQLPWQLLVSCGALKAHVYLLETTAYSIFLLNHLQAPASPACRSEISWQSRRPARSPRPGHRLCLGESSAGLFCCASPSACYQFNLLPSLLLCCPAPSRGLCPGRGCWHCLVLGDPRPGHAVLLPLLPLSLTHFMASRLRVMRLNTPLRQSGRAGAQGVGWGSCSVALQRPPSLAGDVWLCRVSARARGAARRPLSSQEKGTMKRCHG